MAWIVLALALALPGAALANLCNNSTQFDLYADQDVLVGYVAVCNVADQLKVEFNTISSGWPITATHLWVGDDWEDAPQKNGNPIPGQFPYSGYHDGVTEVSYYIPYDAAAGDAVYVAAHAVVWDPASEVTLYVCSDGDESYTAYNNSIYGPDGSAADGRTGTAQPSAEPYGEQDDSRVSAWDYYVGAPFRRRASDGGGPPYNNGCADWIWEDNFKLSQTSTPCDPATAGPTCLNEPVNPINGDRVEFTETFFIPGLPLGGMLYAACDNAYEAYVNTTTPGMPLISGQTGATATYPDWWTSDLRQASASNYSVDTYNWETVEQGLLTGLTMGDNYLFFRAANEYQAPCDWAAYGCQNYGNTPIGGIGGIYSYVTSAYFNPGGIIWQADIDYLSDDETAWGAQDGPATFAFPGKNWATYIEYTWQGPNGG